MRGTVAKRIRRQIYGEQSVQGRRRYTGEITKKTVTVLEYIAKVARSVDRTIDKVTIKNIGLRQQSRHVILILGKNRVNML